MSASQLQGWGWPRVLLCRCLAQEVIDRAAGVVESTRAQFDLVDN